MKFWKTIKAAAIWICLDLVGLWMQYVAGLTSGYYISMFGLIMSVVAAIGSCCKVSPEASIKSWIFFELAGVSTILLLAIMTVLIGFGLSADLEPYSTIEVGLVWSVVAFTAVGAFLLAAEPLVSTPAIKPEYKHHYDEMY